MRNIFTTFAFLSILLFAAAVFEPKEMPNTYTPAAEVLCGDLCK